MSDLIRRIEAAAMTPETHRPAARSAAVFRARMEQAEIAGIKAAAAIPARCGPEIAAAPARGGFVVFTPREMVPGSTQRQRHAGFAGRDTLRHADVFDRMEADARRRHKAAGGADAGFVAPFGHGQVAIARRYRDLVERHAGAGFRCASVEAGHGGGAGGEFIDAFVAEGIEIERIRQRIGRGVAMQLRRVRLSARGRRSRGLISDRALVDRVCLSDETPSAVLRAFGWEPKGPAREALRQALAAALDRMQGYRDAATARSGIDN